MDKLDYARLINVACIQTDWLKYIDKYDKVSTNIS